LTKSFRTHLTGALKPYGRRYGEFEEKELEATRLIESQAKEKAELLEISLKDIPDGGLKIAQARLDAAHASYLAAVKKSEVSNYIVDNLGLFADQEHILEVTRISIARSNSISKEVALAKEIYDIHQNAWNELSKWHEARKARLEFLDFIYFSVGVSTTTTFGDITPNSRGARVAVLLQLTLSLLLLGLIVTRISTPTPLNPNCNPRSEK
jgi:Ion channel.